MNTSFSPLRTLRRLALASLLSLPLWGMAAGERSFATPEAAVQALQEALQSSDANALNALFGPELQQALSSGDAAHDAALRSRLATALATFQLLQPQGEERRILLVGERAWPLPIPLVKQGEAWHFATEEGLEEVANRYIGSNERAAMRVLHAYVDAQRQYASADRVGDGVLQYARKLHSSPGKRDGLYWPTDAAQSEELSPLGPWVADNAPYLAGHHESDPYHGYHFRILTRQGPGAPGGAYDYVINGRLLAGFALLAYPVEYGKTGVMSFIVNHYGKVYERNLGPRTEQAAAHISRFDPTGWQPVGE